jgi:hypothetical protein
MKIQMAKAGAHGGIEITLEQLSQCVRNFDQNDHVPVILGHDSAWDDSMPAMGWVTDVSIDGDYLVGTLELSDQMQKLYQTGEYQNWSVGISLNSEKDECYLHHLAFLGAVPPMIKGLAVIEMGDRKNIVNITCADLAEISGGGNNLLSKEEKIMKNRLQKIEAKMKEAEISTFCDALAGRISKAHIEKIRTSLKTDHMLFSDNAEDEAKGIIALLTEAFTASPKAFRAEMYTLSDLNADTLSAPLSFAKI